MHPIAERLWPNRHTIHLYIRNNVLLNNYCTSHLNSLRASLTSIGKYISPSLYYTHDREELLLFRWNPCWIATNAARAINCRYYQGYQSLIGTCHLLGKAIPWESYLKTALVTGKRNSGGPMFNIRRSSTKCFHILQLFFNPLLPLFTLCPLFA